MYGGWTSLCLPTKDLEASKNFYEALGMKLVEEVSGVRVVLRNGSFRLALMPFLDEPLLNVRGADVAAAHAAATAARPDTSGTVEHYDADAENRADAGGACWQTHDPAGHPILFDTNHQEEGEGFRRARTRQILEDAEEELTALGADPDLLAGLRTLIGNRA